MIIQTFIQMAKCYPTMIEYGLMMSTLAIRFPDFMRLLGPLKIAKNFKMPLLIASRKENAHLFITFKTL